MNCFVTHFTIIFNESNLRRQISKVKIGEDVPPDVRTSLHGEQTNTYAFRQHNLKARNLISLHTSRRKNNYGEKSSSVVEFTGSFWVINRSNCVPEFILSSNEDKSFLFKRSVNVRSCSWLLASLLLELSSEAVSSLGFSGIFEIFTRKIQQQPTYTT